MIKFTKIVSILCISLIMGGCSSVPPILTYIGYVKTAADGISYLVYQKSTADYALSYVRDEDCALHRTFMGEKVCKNKHMDRMFDEMLEAGNFEELGIY